MMGSEAPSYHVVEAVAREDSVSPTEMTPPLFDVISPDALDILVDGTSSASGAPVTVEFEYRGYEVTVVGGDEIEVTVRDVSASKP